MVEINLILFLCTSKYYGFNIRNIKLLVSCFTFKMQCAQLKLD